MGGFSIQSTERPMIIGAKAHPSSLEMSIGEEAQLSYLILFDDGSQESQEVTWESADESIAIVDDNGLVTALTEGSTQIMAENQSVSVTVFDTAEEEEIEE